MRVLEITTCWKGGGAESVARDMCGVMQKNDIEVWYAFSRGEVPSGVNGIRIENTVDLGIHWILARLFDLNGFGGKLATKRFIRKIGRINPDIVHIHNIVGYTLNFEILFRYFKEKNIKIMWTFHDCWPFTGHCISFEDIECLRWIDGCECCPKRKEYPKSILMDNSSSNWRKKRDAFSEGLNLTIVSPSEWLKNKISQSFFKGYACFVVNNGIDLCNFKPTYSNLRNRFDIGGKKILLTVAGSWNLSKGYKHIIELSKLMDSSKYCLAIIGVTSKQVKEFDNTVICIERTNDVKELAEWYTVADVFVNASLADNFPTVNIEAMACGTPVVAYDTGGINEQISKETGIIVRNKCALDLYKGIEKCIECNLLAQDCIDRAKKYDKEVRFLEYIDLYKRIVG